MRLTLRKQSDGELRPYGYAKYTENDGVRKVVNLDVMWSGSLPETLRAG